MLLKIDYAKVHISIYRNFTWRNNIAQPGSFDSPSLDLRKQIPLTEKKAVSSTVDGV
jgi:hypothetical protein